MADTRTAGYIPKRWNCGDPITTDDLNNIETGIQVALDCCNGGGGVFIIHATGTEPNIELDMTCDEMADILDNGGMLIVESSNYYFPLKCVNDNNRPQATSKGLLRGEDAPWLIFSGVDVYSQGVTESKIRVYSDCSVVGTVTTFTGTTSN